VGSLPVRIGVLGASGRMGQQVLQAVMADTQMVLAAAFDRQGSELVGQDVCAVIGGQPTGVIIQDELSKGIDQVDTIIDFTLPEVTLGHLSVCAQHGVSAVVGTTGFSKEQQVELNDFAQKIPIVWAPNMSAGVNVLFELLSMASRALGSQGYDLEIVEAHHKHKVDAPSGTALKMGQVAAEALGLPFEEHAVFSREGITGERQDKAIGFSTIRGGDVVGEHTAFFFGQGERIEITHRSTSRSHYALGAVRAAGWLVDRSADLYGMEDVLGLRQVQE